MPQSQMPTADGFRFA